MNGPPLKVGSRKLSGADPDQFTLSDNTCTTPVSAGGHCTFRAHFAPTSAGAKSATLAVAHNAGGGPLRVELRGTGLAPLIEMPRSPAFGDHTVFATASAGERSVAGPAAP